MAYTPLTWANRNMDLDKWRAAPEDFTYPWGDHWRDSNGSNLGKVVRPRGRARYSTRRMSAFDRKMLNRITSNKRLKLEELGYHPDQLILF